RSPDQRHPRPDPAPPAGRRRERRTLPAADGVQFGDLIDFVDFDFIARVTRVNAAALWGLASHPSTPKGLLIHTAPPPGLPGTNLTSLEWTANPEANLRGYEVVLRETTEADWTRKIPVGNVNTVTLDISKDNVQFGLRAVDARGNHSPVAFPTVVN